MFWEMEMVNGDWEVVEEVGQSGLGRTRGRSVKDIVDGLAFWEMPFNAAQPSRDSTLTPGRANKLPLSFSSIRGRWVCFPFVPDRRVTTGRPGVDGGLRMQRGLGGRHDPDRFDISVTSSDGMIQLGLRRQVHNDGNLNKHSELLDSSSILILYLSTSVHNRRTDLFATRRQRVKPWNQPPQKQPRLVYYGPLYLTRANLC